MKILITGNMGYIGPSVVNRLRASYPDAQLIGLDIGYFAHCLTGARVLPESHLDVQHFLDVRAITPELLEGVDAIVHLAAISNDPMGNAFEEVTLAINYKASVALAKLAKAAGVGAFVFASSCSVYGFAEGGARTEDSAVNPLTAYARSKINTENDLQGLADEQFTVTSLRFATACGMSDRLRLDLVLNDFVASAVTTNKITILSDGSPWRPLIDIKDMARAIDWAIGRDSDTGGDFLALNTGSNQWNYQVKNLAEAAAEVIPGLEIAINKDAMPDKRSYQVSFDLFEKLAPDYQPQVDLQTAIEELREGLEVMRFNDPDFRESTLMRLKMLTELEQQGLLSNNLEWRFNA
jgi:nucleoside-diphosphate-sugar epimerase